LRTKQQIEQKVASYNQHTILANDAHHHVLHDVDGCVLVSLF